LSPEAVLENAVDGADAVSPADFFAFFVGAAVVGNGNFVDGDLELGDLGGDFRLEAEAVFLDGDFFEDVALEDLVAGLHISEVQVGEHVGHEGEELVAHGVPEVEHAVHAGTEEARAKDDIGLAEKDGREELRVLVGVVFEVGILDDDDVGMDMLEAGAKGGTFALVDLMGEDADAVVGLGELLHGVPCTVFGAIVDHHELRDLGSGKDFLDDEVKRAFLVVDGDDDAKAAGGDGGVLHGKKC
jgi:hypothetical protein